MSAVPVLVIWALIKAVEFVLLSCEIKNFSLPLKWKIGLFTFITYISFSCSLIIVAIGLAMPSAEMHKTPSTEVKNMLDTLNRIADLLGFPILSVVKLVNVNPSLHLYFYVLNGLFLSFISVRGYFRLKQQVSRMRR